jgi:hypothetical protein
MDEELVEVRDATHPSDSEEARRWPGSNGRDEICEPCLLQCEPSPFGESAPRAGDDESRRGEEVVFTQDEVGCEVVRCPRIKERRSLWAEFVQQIAELRALDGIEEQSGHVDPA